MLPAPAPPFLLILAAVAVTRDIRGFQQPVGEIERRIIEIADLQRGLIATEQLLSLGLSQDAVEHRVAVGRLARVHRGVFVVGRARLDIRARWKAATLACGPNAMLSHLSAAGLWRIRPAPRGDSHVLRFVELCRYHRIRLPKINHDIENLMVDAVWDAERAIVELDGYEFHKLPRDLRQDNARNRRLVLAGYRVIRFVWRDLVDDPGGVAQAVRSLLAGGRAPLVAETRK